MVALALPVLVFCVGVDVDVADDEVDEAFVDVLFEKCLYLLKKGSILLFNMMDLNDLPHHYKALIICAYF